MGRIDMQRRIKEGWKDRNDVWSYGIFSSGLRHHHCSWQQLDDGGEKLIETMANSFPEPPRFYWNWVYRTSN